MPRCHHTDAGRLPKGGWCARTPRAAPASHTPVRVPQLQSPRGSGRHTQPPRGTMPKRTVAIDDCVPRAHAAQQRCEFGARHATAADQPSRRGARLRERHGQRNVVRAGQRPGGTVTPQRHLYDDHGHVDVLRLRSHNHENRTKPRGYVCLRDETKRGRQGHERHFHVYVLNQWQRLLNHVL